MRSRWLITLGLVVVPAVASAKLEPYPIVNRFGISLGFGFGSAALSSFHDGIDAARAYLATQGVSLQSSPKSNLQINTEIGFRYYFQYYMLAHLGYDAVYNHAASDLVGGGGGIKTDQLAMEVPILVGGYYPFFGRLTVFGAIGPSPFFFPRSWISADPGSYRIAASKAGAGCGFHFLTGAEFLVTRSLALGLELRYRYLKAGDLQDLDTGQPLGTRFGSSQAYNLDLSGVSLGVTIRAFAM